MPLPRGCLKMLVGLAGLLLFFLALAGLPEIFPDNGVLAAAIYEGDVERVRNLLERGADPNSRSAILSELCWWLGMTRSSSMGLPDFSARRPLLLLALDHSRLEIAKLLVQHGADPNVQDQDLALGRAVDLGDAVLVRAMLASGANPLLETQDGATALRYGREMRFAPRTQNAEIIRLIREAANSQK